MKTRGSSLFPIVGLFALYTFVVPALVAHDSNCPENGREEECEIEAEGAGFISVGESNRFCFAFEFEIEGNEIEGRFKAFDQESGICIRSCRVIGFEKVDDHTLVINLEVLVGEQAKTTITLKITDGGNLGPDTLEVTLEDGTVLSGEVQGRIRIELECEQDHEQKPKCKGGKFCKGHPICKEHPFCEVPNCKGHKNCHKKDCTGHPGCRKNFKHKNGCKAKFDPKKRCTCKSRI